MHIQHAVLGDVAPHVSVSEPWSGESGHVFEPAVELWPLGQGTGPYWSLSCDEARAIIAALQDGVRQAEELFPPG